MNKYTFNLKGRALKENDSHLRNRIFRFIFSVRGMLFVIFFWLPLPPPSYPLALKDVFVCVYACVRVFLYPEKINQQYMNSLLKYFSMIFLKFEPNF